MCSRPGTKYNIDIYFITQDIQNSIGNLVKQLKNGEQIGVVARLTTRHDNPLIICKNNEEIYIVVMDYLKIKDDSFWGFFSSPSKLIEVFGTEHCHLLHAGIPRQQDTYSCINDATIILKNALRKPNLINDLFNTSQTVDVTYDDEVNGKTCYQVGVAEFPKFLYKTVQNKQLLDELTTEDLQTHLKQSTDISSKTVQTHLNKYNRVLTVLRETTSRGSPGTNTNTVKDWEVNTYLQTKPYRMVVKSFDKIADSNGKINQETATKLVNKYVNPSF
jgi:hypothetical protein